MSLYQYIKAAPRVHLRPRGYSTVASFFFMTAGAGLLAWVLWPIVSFMIFTAPLFSKTVSPIPDPKSYAVNTLSEKVLAANDENKTQAVTVDYSNANIWFPTKPQKRVDVPMATYVLSIPKLKINRATVVVGSDDLNKSLVHYGGTGLPGDFGNTVVFGHSTLIQFYNPKDYKTIFSLLPTLTPGDDIYIDYDGLTYRYTVFNLMISDPSDLSSLEQQYDDSYLTLITCVPPGTYYQRLHVKAKLNRL